VKQLKETLIIAWLAAIFGLPIYAGVNLKRILEAPAAPLADLVPWVGVPVAVAVLLVVFRGLLFGIKVPAAGKDDFPVPPVATDKAEYDLSLPGGCRVSVTLLGKVDPNVVTKVKELLSLAAGGGK
jgi:hypothetical protein